jgi:L-threonylcarbamoyladenylate synthase
MYITCRGGICIYPTDTLYAIGVDAFHTNALKKLKHLKQRDAGKPISIMIKSKESMREYGQMNESAEKIAEAFMPGGITLVCAQKPRIPKDLNAIDEIGMRMPDTDFCRVISKAYKNPITVTSANISGEPTLYTVSDILDAFKESADSIDFIIDGGILENSSSTIVSCVSETPEIIREGAIPSGTIFDIFV